MFQSKKKAARKAERREKLDKILKLQTRKNIILNYIISLIINILLVLALLFLFDYVINKIIDNSDLAELSILKNFGAFMILILLCFILPFNLFRHRAERNVSLASQYIYYTDIGTSICIIIVFTVYFILTIT